MLDIQLVAASSRHWDLALDLQTEIAKKWINCSHIIIGNNSFAVKMSTKCLF